MKGAMIGEEFKPSSQFKKLYYIYFTPILLILLVVLQFPIYLLSIPLLMLVGLIFSLPILLIILFVMYWIPKYYGSMNYKLTDDEMTWRRGVWFKKTGIVPYNRITNIDISQGPVSRSLGIAALKIQTAGYSGPSTTTSEIKIEGMEDFEGMRESIMGLVRGRKPVAVETYDSPKGKDPLLNELVKIRELLEKR